MYLKAGQFIRIKREWMQHPCTYVHGIIIEIRKTKYDSDYRFVKLLQLAGKITDEPVKFGSRGTTLEVIS